MRIAGAPFTVRLALFTLSIRCVEPCKKRDRFFDLFFYTFVKIWRLNRILCKQIRFRSVEPTLFGRKLKSTPLPAGRHRQGVSFESFSLLALETEEFRIEADHEECGGLDPD